MHRKVMAGALVDVGGADVKVDAATGKVVRVDHDD